MFAGPQAGESATWTRTITGPPARTTSCSGPTRTGKEWSGVKLPCYIGLQEARQVLAEMGVELNSRQIKRAADKDAHGRRKLPVFVDPTEGTLKIEKGTLVRFYSGLQLEIGKTTWREK